LDDRGLSRAAAELRAADRVWIGTHVDPDGDAIGSLLGLGCLLRDIAKSVTLACQDPAPPEVAFLPGIDRIGNQPPAANQMVVALDVADRGRLGTLLPPDARPDLVLDHHVSNLGFGRTNVVAPEAASTAEVVLALADAMGLAPGAEAATCLLTGVVSDSLGFRTSNTTTATLVAAQRLMAHGADLAAITAQVFARPLGTLRLAARAIERLELHGPFALTSLRLSDLDDLGVPISAVRGITMLLSGAAEPAVLAVLRERPDGTIDVSLRSKRGVNVVPVAMALGGGGHPQAAGAQIAGPLDAASRHVLATIETQVQVDPAGGAPPATAEARHVAVG
jgi:bifunctional oligoribonuclease and PAP phosphatase NrnA